MTPPSPAVLLVGPLYTSAVAGLAADLAVARALGRVAAPVCTAIVAAGGGRVSDVVEVPSDSVRAQLEHLVATVPLRGARVAALGTARSAEAVFRALDSVDGPVVLDAVASGPYGETLLDGRGLDVLTDRMGCADLVLFSRRDAELMSGGAIASLDDAQVAVQRLHRRGAQRVVVRCGRLPARFFDAAEDPGGDGAPGALESDLYYDGHEFALFEATHVDGPEAEGAAAAFAVCALDALLDGSTFEEALQTAKGYVTEAIRHGSDVNGRRTLELGTKAEVRRP